MKGNPGNHWHLIQGGELQSGEAYLKFWLKMKELIREDNLIGGGGWGRKIER